MKKVMRVKCPNCSHKFEISRTYDEHFDSMQRCPNCSWQVSLWGFDADEEVLELDHDDYKLPRDNYM